jgi:putative DNA primase/helicase
MTRNTIDAARGRWREILIALDVPAKALNGRNQPCLLCGGKDRARFTDRLQEGDYFCNQCGSRTGLQLLRKLRGWDFKRAADEVDKIIGNLPAAKPSRPKPRAPASELTSIWQAGLVVSADDPVGEYLMRRGIALDDVATGELRFISMLQHHPSKSGHPAMVARMRDASGKPAQLHRTYLTIDGQKAAVDPVRMFMPGELPIGGAIRLGEPFEGVLGVAEGIETALSAAIIYGMPVWATTSAIMLEQWQPPSEATSITIFGDSDNNYVGQAAAYILARRLIFEAARDKIARSIEVALPPRGLDWNDVLLKKACAPGDCTDTRGTLRQGRPALDERSSPPVP